MLAAGLAGGAAPPGRPPADGRRPIAPLPAPPPAALRDRVALGARLYGDPRLSASGRISCQSCHDLASNGATGARRDPGDNGAASPFNTPTVFNSALNFRFNWQGGMPTLPDVVAASLRNPHVMGGSAPGLRRLRADRTLLLQARAAYRRDLDEAVLIDALSRYVRTLTTPGARFDRWLGGDRAALTAQEQRGWEMFQAVGCVSCHQGANIGGNLFERHGIFHPLAAGGPPVLRVPSLRNVAATAPYFHDGSAPTLAGAVRAMAYAQLDITLSERDVRDIVAFLGTLTGHYEGRPVHPAAR
ncbi:cytochrome-c peroxidase [Sphingomonas morindae]|uniref:C-type cytochrome n=1 Tax=Sphingomonas morindae TaxID=1541170 RepID=A0ABY4XDI6_9SPHN|nr:cytochrome c peroxidase [Sphingomonas morindae]USI74909.1 c-type cytochrome [Sphingomonas morindae]